MIFYFLCGMSCVLVFSDFLFIVWSMSGLLLLWTVPYGCGFFGDVVLSDVMCDFLFFMLCVVW